MKNFLHSLTYIIPLFGLSLSLHTNLFADKQADAAAEQRRLDNERQEQKIEDRKLEDQQYDDRRQEQERINRQLEDRRIEQRRIDNARQQRRLTGYELAARDRDRRDDFRDRVMDRDDQDLMDDTIDERFLNQALNRDEHPNTPEHQAGCMTCQERQALLNQMEQQQFHHNEEYQQRKSVVEQWDRDHSRD